MAVAATAILWILAGCSSDPVSFAKTPALKLLPTTEKIGAALHTTLSFTLEPTKSVQTHADSPPKGACGEAVSAFANARSKDNAYERMTTAAGGDIQLNAVRYRSEAIAITAMKGWQSVSELCPTASDSGIESYSTGVEGVYSWISTGRRSAAFREGDTISYLNTSLGAKDTARVIAAQLAFVRAIAKAS